MIGILSFDVGNRFATKILRMPCRELLDHRTLNWVRFLKGVVNVLLAPWLGCPQRDPGPERLALSHARLDPLLASAVQFLELEVPLVAHSDGDSRRLERPALVSQGLAQLAFIGDGLVRHGPLPGNGQAHLVLPGGPSVQLSI